MTKAAIAFRECPVDDVDAHGMMLFSRSLELGPLSGIGVGVGASAGATVGPGSGEGVGLMAVARVGPGLTAAGVINGVGAAVVTGNCVAKAAVGIGVCVAGRAVGEGVGPADSRDGGNA